jgi:hypothetical protein
MGKAANTLTAIQLYLLTTIQPEHSVTDQYNGMHFTDFIKTFKDLKVLYPCKNDRTQFLIELTEQKYVVTCEMVNNICVKGYIFKNE